MSYSEDLFASGQEVIIALCLRCEAGTVSARCGRCGQDGAACAACGRCPGCDGPAA